ncbi:RNase P modulator RnpM [Virgibacillus flavescens]|uniref:RNase P modulator RnpM n=1 Tax=Virgibacillus flavescens TaxID=1611422 RepID=UPI003D34FD7D
MAQTRKVPERKCIISNEMKPKKELIRVVRNKDGEVFVDETGKKNGRGAYLTKDITIIEKAEKTNALNRHLNTQVDASIFEELKQLISGKKNEK